MTHELLWRKVFFRWALPVVMAIIGVHLAESWGRATVPIDILALFLTAAAWTGILLRPESFAGYAEYLVDGAVLTALSGGVWAAIFLPGRQGFEVLEELAFWAPVVSVYWVTVYYRKPALAILLILILYAGILWGDWVGHFLYNSNHFAKSLFTYAAQAILLVGLMNLFSTFQRREATLKKRLEEAVDNALRDPLTLLPNRRFFDQELSRGCERATRDGTKLSVVIADIDHFKRFNDNFGHSYGDGVLKTAAQVISERIRLSDWACRWGGEEFAIILHNTDIMHAAQIAEELRQAFASAQAENGMCATISLGVSEYREGEVPHKVFDRADHALFRAKSSGRNRVEMDSLS